MYGFITWRFLTVKFLTLLWKVAQNEDIFIYLKYQQTFHMRIMNGFCFQSLFGARGAWLSPWQTCGQPQGGSSWNTCPILMCNLEMKHVAIPIVGNLEILGVETASRWVFSKHVAMIRVLESWNRRPASRWVILQHVANSRRTIMKHVTSLKMGNVQAFGHLKKGYLETFSLIKEDNLETRLPPQVSIE